MDRESEQLENLRVLGAAPLPQIPNLQEIEWVDIGVAKPDRFVQDIGLSQQTLLLRHVENRAAGRFVLGMDLSEQIPTQC